MVPITVHASFHSGDAELGQLKDLPPLFNPPPFQFEVDQELSDISPPPSIGWRLKVLGEDFRDFITFDPIQKAELKLQFAEERQREIDDLSDRGIPIPVEYEERRVQKLNEARLIVIERTADTPSVAGSSLARVIDSFRSVQQLGELNDIRILYSQLPEVINADDEVKQRFNDRVNELDTFQENCIGEFDVNTIDTMSVVFDRIAEQCPRLVELEQQFGKDRIRSVVTDSP